MDCPSTPRDRRLGSAPAAHAQPAGRAIALALLALAALAPPAAAGPAPKLELSALVAPDTVLAGSTRSLRLCLLNQGAAGQLERAGSDVDRLVLHVPLGPEAWQLEADGSLLACGDRPAGWDCSIAIGLDEVQVSLEPSGASVAVASFETVCFELEGLRVNAREGVAVSRLEQLIDSRRAMPLASGWLAVFKAAEGAVRHDDLSEVRADQHHAWPVPSSGLADGSVISAKLADGGVTEAKLGAGSVTGAKIADGTVGTVDVMDGSIKAAKLASEAVTPAKLAPAAVGTAALADGAVTGAKIADGSVGSVDVMDGSIKAAKLAPAAVGTAALADGAVTSAKIADGSVTTADVMDGSVTAVKLASAAVTSTKLAGSAVGTMALADGAVTSAKIADGSVTTADVMDGSMTAAKLASGAVTAPKIAAGAVSSAALANGAVGAAQVDMDAVQLRVSGGCAVGSSIRSITAGGAVVCDSGPSFQLGTWNSSRFSCSADSRCWATRSCPAGQRVVAGGCGHIDENSAARSITVNYSGPINGNTWLCQITNGNLFDSRAYEIWWLCATP